VPTFFKLLSRSSVDQKKAITKQFAFSQIGVEHVSNLFAVIASKSMLRVPA